jgi:signal transduction histidine kinase
MSAARRVLVIDDHRAIHDDFRKILHRASPSALSALEDDLFGRSQRPNAAVHFQVDSAYQGEEGIARARAAKARGEPYALAFVDMRMPPGIGGLETIEQLWGVDPEVQVIICTAYSDASWTEIVDRLGATDRLMILKKPFDLAEVLQMALALSEKWRLAQEARAQLAQLDASRAELAASLAMAQAVQSAIGDGILVVSADRRVKATNPRFLEMWNVSQALAASGNDDELLGHALAQMADPEEFLARVRHLYAHPQETSAEEVHLKDGRVLERWSGPVHAASGEAYGRLWRFRDISERRRHELERAVVTERLAAMGRLAAGVGHEINNPLTYVLCNVEDLLAAHGEGAPPSERSAVEALSEARDGLYRIRVIVRDLQTLARVDAEQGEVDLAQTLDRALQFAAAEVRHRAQVVRRYEAVRPVMGSGVRLAQVFLNLIINAAQSIPEGHVSEHRIVVTVRSEGTTAVVEVSDTGCGIDPEDLGSIFDPFFTTKRAGEGTGLGLSICREIIHSHGGTVAVASQRGQGTTMTVRLPSASALASRSSTAGAPAISAAQAPGPLAASAAPGGRRAKLLIVDDEPLVARALERVLVARHNVTVTTRAREALSRIERGERFDVILCDLMMPEVSGMDVYQQLERENPALASRVVFMTGGAFSAQAQEFLASRNQEVLCKPFTATQVHGVVERMLASS